MKIKNTKTCYTYAIEFSEGEWKIIAEGWMPDTFWNFTSYIWCSELEALEECETYYMSQYVEVILSQDVPDILHSVVKEFLEKAEIN